MGMWFVCGWKITASASRRSIRNESFASSSGCIGTNSIPAPGSAWRLWRKGRRLWAAESGSIRTRGRGAVFGSSCRRAPRLFSFPPQHQFEAGAVRIGTGHPALEQFKVGTEALHQLILVGSEGRPILVRDHVMDGQKIAAGLQPAQDGLRIGVAQSWIDGAIERVFEKPIERFGGLRLQKIRLLKIGVQAGCRSFLAGEPNRGGREVETVGFEASAGPDARIVTGAAAGHRD